MRLVEYPASSVRLWADRWTAPFWEAGEAGRLVVAQCGGCDRFRMPPLPRCPRCRSDAMRWVELPGTGTIHTFTVVHRAVSPSASEHVPDGVVLVALDGAPVRLAGTVTGCDREALRIGARVEAVWSALERGRAMPRFRVVDGAEDS